MDTPTEPQPKPEFTDDEKALVDMLTACLWHSVPTIKANAEREGLLLTKGVQILLSRALIIGGISMIVQLDGGRSPRLRSPDFSGEITGAVMDRLNVMTGRTK